VGAHIQGINIILMPCPSRLQPDFNETIKIDVPISIAGAFAFHTTFSPLPPLSAPGSATNSETQTPTYYIDVSPALTVNDSKLPIDSLSIFSVISKCMGEYPRDWEKHLQGIKSREYNMVHFTPLMERGGSNSPYSIRDQLKFDPVCFPRGEDDLVNLIGSMEKKHELLGLTDVVWNHTSYDSKWLEAHPEAGYSVETAPWLESALELDDALLAYGRDLSKFGFPTILRGLDDLSRVVEGVKAHVLRDLKLWEYYVVNVERDAAAIAEAWSLGNIAFPVGGFGSTEIGGLEGVKDWSLKRQARFLGEKGLLGASELGPRFHRKVDPCVGAALLTVIYGHYDSKNKSLDRRALLEKLKHVLDELNVAFYQEYDADVVTILQQIFDRVKYLRLDEHGPKLGTIDSESPFIESYFTRLPSNPETQKHKPASLALVNNGWIWNADAMKDHAGPDSRAYLRREVVVWGDCVKLRYGKSPADNPFLWDFMTKYTKLMAKYFAGFRIDNCHSTPLVVAEHLLDKAREVRPNLVVFAELFTGSEEMDYVFVERLGLSALIREAMQAGNAKEMSRLVHLHGGRPIGSFEVDEVSSHQPVSNSTSDIKGPNRRVDLNEENIHRIRRSPVHALFMDCTHDNEVPAQKRTAEDTLPNTALVNLCACATGSVFGYDEIYPKHIDIVKEKRLYSSPYSEEDEKEVARTSGPGGIGGIKKLLNQIHTLAGQEGYDETHIHHEGQYITVHRVHPKSRKGFFVIAHMAFPGITENDARLAPVQLIGSKANLLGTWKLEVETGYSTIDGVVRDSSFLKGLPSLVLDLPGIGLHIRDDMTVVSVPDEFPRGSVALLETWIPGAEHSDGLDKFVSTGAPKAFAHLSLVQMNFVLYRSDPEERDSSAGRDGVYNIPGFGPLVYAGLQGWWSVLRNIIRTNDLGHPLCNHLREGQWALDYIIGRLKRISKQDGYSSLDVPAQWLAERFDAIRKLPNFLLPRYFALVIQTAYQAAWRRCISLMNANVQNGQGFLQSLAMTGVQLTGPVSSASLYPSSVIASLAAGLPHFATSWTRCWGRDIFIALRGLFLATGRYEVAKDHIMAFASVLKHGMIPNLLSNGRNPRYNSRDAVWFFLQSIQDYCNMVPSGIKLLQQKVVRRFLPYDDTYFEAEDPRAYSEESSIEEIVQEVLQRHASGLSFREANAGPGLDSQMKPKGFQIDVKVNWSTGLIFGGNQFNCGTWMDKMGESEKAGSKGIPATPRDGAAIEITGLAYSTLAWVARLHGDGIYRHSGANTGDGNIISFADWASRIKMSFERCYYIPLDPHEDPQYEVNTAVVNRRGIYKDLFKSGKEYEDYQLRPNFPIAMTVAPDLFTPAKALHALEVVDTVLRGPTGMATLDPSDLQYRPYYNNSEDSTDFATAKGRNYHQGPEWLWPTGFFLRALLKFDLKRRNTPEARTEAFQQITRRLKGCKKAIEESPWAGLVELTNKNGEPCADTVSDLEVQ
jgi:glycogen debranching enzyme